MEGRRYLGDGVYVRFDGYSIHLAVNNHRNEVIVVEPDVATALVMFINHALENKLTPVPYNK